MRVLGTAVGIALLLTAGLMLHASRYAGPTRAHTFLDREGRFIGTLDPAPQGLQIFTPLERIPPGLIERTIASEDRFFRWHRGINPFSLFSALLDDLSAGRVVRGGSTITQQLARNILQAREGKVSERTLFNKAREALLAVGLELIRGKAWILERYLNAIYYGRRAYGVGAAAAVYFDREPPELTASQIETLVGLPKAPGQRGAALAKIGGAPSDLAGRHFTEFVERERPAAREAPIVRTTLDLDLQRRVEAAIRETLARRAAEDSLLTAAAVAIDVRTGDVLAMAGSRDYRDERIDGKVNAAVALRQPGSTLKPFTSFAAFAKGFGPDSIVPDQPLSFTASGAEEEAYAPQNFDRRFHGRISMRRALANSYNIPAVATLNDIGLSFYHELLRGFGFTTFVKPPPHYGLAVTLGAGEVTLLELTNAYAALARSGRFLPARVIASDPHALPRAVLDGAERFAAMVTEILADPSARLPAFGFNAAMEIEGHPVAVKTGTSYEHRDTWTVGYTPSYAVGVWVGHADGSPLPATAAVSGATSAAPVWHAIMEALLRGKPAEPFPRIRMPEPEGPAPEIAAGSKAAAGNRVTVLSPLSHATYRMHAWLPPEHQLIAARALVTSNAGTRLRWELDGELLAVTDEPRPKVFLEPQPGRHLLTIATDDGTEREIPFRVLAPDAVAALEE